jgi:hypothetical protein
VSTWMQEKPLQVPSLVESFHDARIMDKLKRTRVPPDGEHVGNGPGDKAVEEDAPRGACLLPRNMSLLNHPRQYGQEEIWSCLVQSRTQLSRQINYETTYFGAVTFCYNFLTTSENSYK